MSLSPDLESLWADIRACRICRDEPIGKPLPHEPRPVVRPSSVARILIAGQAPGTRVHASGIPFDDRSGDRLRDWLGVTADEFYDMDRFAIVPMGFCFPGLDAKGGDLPPRRECAPAWRDALLARLPAIEFTLAIGRYAQVWHLPAGGKPLTEVVRDWRAHWPHAVALPHPSPRNNVWLARNPWFERQLVPRLQARVRQVLDASAPPGPRRARASR